MLRVLEFLAELVLCLFFVAFLAGMAFFFIEVSEVLK